MATQYNSIIRLKKIDECIRNRTKIYHLPELIQAISEELERHDKKVKVSERTVYNDLKFLKDEYGPFAAPVVKSNSKGYIYSESEYSIFNPMMDDKSIEKVKNSLSALRQVSKLTGYEDLREIVLRMEASYNFDDDHQIDPIVYLEEGLNIAALDRIEPLKSYIQAKEVINITYEPFDKPAYARIVSPYFLKEYNNRWFLFGHQHAISTGDYEGMTNMPLDRIRDIKPSLKTYQPKGEIDIKSYFSKIVGVSVFDMDLVTIEFRVYGARRHYVSTKKIHHSQRNLEMNEEYATFSISVIPNNELYSSLLSFGGDLEVLSPPPVRQRMIEKAEAMIGRYG